MFKSQSSDLSLRRGFTLIELLVVIAIIAILAAILFPVFGRAHENARRSSCQSNMKQIGLGIMQYTQDFDEFMPQGYYYPNDSSSSGGYVHWSGATEPYTKSWGVFQCPSDPFKLAPTCFTGDNLGYGVPNGQTAQGSCAGIQDKQAPRLSYIANEMVLPRKRRTADAPKVVKLATIDNTAEVIAIAEITSYAPSINDSSTASGVAFKSHRPINAISVGGTVYDPDASAAHMTSTINALSISQAKTAIDASRAPGGSGSGNHHIVYGQLDRHLDGSNYIFCDGHVKWYKLEQTLNPNGFLWGKRHYPGDNSQIMKADNSGPVG